MEAERLVPRLERLFDRIAAGTADAVQFLGRQERLEELRRCYGKTHFARLPGIAPARPLAEAARLLKPLLEPLFEPVVARHSATADGGLGYGSRFNRLDPGLVRDRAVRERLEGLFGAIGLTGFGARLGACLTPLVSEIAGALEWRRIYLYLSREGDYVGIHDDSHVGDRVDVQFPVSIGGTGGIRTLSDELFDMHVDSPGTANVLGSRMWHEVPPFVRAARAKDAFRLNLGLRFVPPAEAGDAAAAPAAALEDAR